MLHAGLLGQPEYARMPAYLQGSATPALSKHIMDACIQVCFGGFGKHE